MRRYGLPVVPTVIGVILGPTSEGKLRQALQVSNGDWSTLWGTGFSILMYVVIAGLLSLAVVRAMAARRTARTSTAPEPERDRAGV
jgi:putative tricarboxylic transport membrane protein